MELLAQLNGGEWKRFAAGPVVVGRAETAQLHVAGVGVSRQHLALQRDETGWSAVDCSSAGTTSMAFR